MLQISPASMRDTGAVMWECVRAGNFRFADHPAVACSAGPLIELVRATII